MTARSVKANDRIFESGIVFREPDFRGVRVCEHLEVVGIANLLVGVDVDKNGHCGITWGRAGRIRHRNDPQSQTCGTGCIRLL